jgi:hypothetical protein
MYLGETKNFLSMGRRQLLLLDNMLYTHGEPYEGDRKVFGRYGRESISL